jgi:hypothetical protein
MSNNAAEREIRPIAMGRKNWSFAGSDEGARRGSAIYTLIQTAKLNDVDPQAWLTDVLARPQDHPARRIDELLPWNWIRSRQQRPRRSCAGQTYHAQPPSPRPSPDAYNFPGGTHQPPTRVRRVLLF